MKHLAAVAALLTLVGCTDNGTSTTEQLAQIRAANQKYQTAQRAISDGFVVDAMCVDAGMVGAPAALGGMGIHYPHPGRLGITQTSPRVAGNDGVIDPEQPEVLIYEPQADGSRKLVAVEYMVFESAWLAAGHSSPPALFGQPFAYMKDVPGTPGDEAHGFEPHYELHVWLYRDNPNGMFAEFNPAVSCANAAALAR
jgi:hypothetical protein